MMRTYACFVIKPIMVDYNDVFFNFMPVGRASDYMTVPIESYSFYLEGAGASCLIFGPPRFNWCFFFCSRFSALLFGAQGSPLPDSLLHL